MDIAAAVRQLRIERDRAANEVQRLDAALAALSGSNRGGRAGKTRTLSVAARARIAAAQRERWAKIKAGKSGNGAKSGKRTLSLVTRARIAKAQRARLAKAKASKKAA